MRRLLLLAALVAAVVPVVASAAPHKAAHGVIVALGDHAIVVRTSDRRVVCAVGVGSPALAAYHLGQRVAIVCAGRPTTLTRIAALPAAAKAGSGSTAPGASANDVQTVTFGGRVSAVSSSSITVHDGDRDLTCTVDSTSEPTAGLQVGDQVKVICAGGVLVSWARPGPGDAAHVWQGKATAVSSSSLTFTTDGGSVTCTVASDSPSTAHIAVGDRIKVGCRVGTNALVLVVDLGPSDGGHAGNGGQQTAGTTGSVTALTSSSITVHNGEGHDLTCTIGSSSPSTAAIHVGDTVKLGCLNGALYVIAPVATAGGGDNNGGGGDSSGSDDGNDDGAGPGTTTTTTTTTSTPTTTTSPEPPHNVTVAQGTLASLSATSITVTTDGGGVTCSVGGSSPHTGDFHLGDRVRMGCVNGVLYGIVAVH